MVVLEFESYEKTIPEILDKIKAYEILEKQENILIKPNIVNMSPFPITTSPEICGEIIKYIRKHSSAAIIIGDGCGEPDYTTLDAFNHLGYKEISDKYDVKLVDLNNVPLKIHQPKLHSPQRNVSSKVDRNPFYYFRPCFKSPLFSSDNRVYEKYDGTSSTKALQRKIRYLE